MVLRSKHQTTFCNPVRRTWRKTSVRKSGPITCTPLFAKLGGHVDHPQRTVQFIAASGLRIGHGHEQIDHSRRKREEERGKKKEGRRKREEERGKKKWGRRNREEERGKKKEGRRNRQEETGKKK